MRNEWIFLTATAVVFAVAQQGHTASPEFSSDVRPILSDHCFACHGPDEADRKSDLRLDTKDGLASVITAGDIDASELVRRLESDDPDEQMPPPEFHKPLGKKQIAVLRAWIAGGAEFQQHWAFVPPQASGNGGPHAIDRLLDQEIEAAGLTANDIADKRTLLRRVCLDLTGLPPSRDQIAEFLSDESPIAYENLVDRLLQSPRYGEHMGRFWHDLVRYGDTHGLHLDNYREMWRYRDWVINAFNQNMPMNQFITEQLAGDLLPNPSQDQLIASGFNRLNVTTNEGGSIYEEVFARNLIDRTDAFGTIFMGLTTGCAVCHDHKFDPISQRDYYSLSAFFNSLDGREMDGNDKAPAPTIRVADESQTTELASLDDSLNEIRREMQGPIASVDAAQAAWQRSLTRSEEANEYVIQPLQVTSQADIAMNILEDGSFELVGDAADKDITTIVAELPDSLGSQWQTLKLEALTNSADDRVGDSANGNVVLSEITIETADPDDHGPNTVWSTVPILHGVASHEQASGPFGISYAYDKKLEAANGWAVAGHEKPGSRTAWFVVPALMGQPDGTKIRIQLKYQSNYAKHQFKHVRLSLSDSPPALDDDQVIHVGDLHCAGPFPIDGASEGYARGFNDANKTFDSEQEIKHGDEVYRWQKCSDLVPVEVNQIPSLEDKPSVMVIHQALHAPSAQTIHLLIGNDDGHVVFLNGKQIAMLRGERTMTPLGNEYPLELKKGENHLNIKLVNHSDDNQLTFAFRSLAIPAPQSLVNLVTRPENERSKLENDSIRKYYREVCCVHPDWLAMRDLEKGIITAREKLEAEIPTTLVWKELDKPRDAHILIRGQYDQLGQIVPRATPSFLPPLPEELSRDRLGLANWLTSAEHPLTARVLVNRFWQQVFGTGLVKTSEDFGSQGEPPSHPELLDTLAIDFRDSGWDVKRLMKTLVMTKAYRRDQHATKRMLETDPENRLFARGPRHRLDAEMLRDQALATSGLLVNQLGGKSVKPPQPEGLWYAVAYTSSNTARFIPDTGDDIYRRSVYTFWKRTSSPPQMSTFDAPSRESCTARRERTNTPLQALLLMNDTQYFEAAKYLAKRTLAQTDQDSPQNKIAWMFETATIRPPTDNETQELLTLLDDLTMHYQENPGAAKQLADEDGELLAPWTILANTLLNLDEVVSK